MDHIPQRLQERLRWTPVSLAEHAKPMVLLLYAGRDDAGSLNACLHAHHAWISPFVQAIDTRRDPRKLGQDMLAAEPYNTLCTLAAHGHVPSVCGGPNCRTWSILRWFLKPGAPSTDARKHRYGRPGLTETDQWDVDSDSTLLLTQVPHSYHSSRGPFPQAAHWRSQWPRMYTSSWMKL
jgi:hypothetical protein